MGYKEHEVNVTNKEKKRIESLLKSEKNIPKKLSITVKSDNAEGGNQIKLLLTKAQIRGRKSRIIHLSSRQIRANIRHEGGFLSALLSTLPMLAARMAPYVLPGLATGLLSAGVDKVFGGDGVYIRKGRNCYRADPVKGDGLFLSRQKYRAIPIKHGNGLFLKRHGQIFNGRGLILGKNSPFKNIPILGWIL